MRRIVFTLVIAVLLAAGAAALAYCRTDTTWTPDGACTCETCCTRDASGNEECDTQCWGEGCD